MHHFTLLLLYIHGVFLNSPKLSLQFPSEQVVKILLFILDNLMCLHDQLLYSHNQTTCYMICADKRAGAERITMYLIFPSVIIKFV